MEETGVKQDTSAEEIPQAQAGVTQAGVGAFFARAWEWLKTYFPKLVWVVPPLVVLCAMLIFYKSNGLYPFGEKTVAWCDMDQQVIPLLMQFKDILSGKEGFFYSFKNAGGMNFFGVFFFFLSSPFSLLMAFVDKAEASSFANVLVMLKMCAIALTASIYLARKIPKNPLLNIALSVLYAYSGYTMMYYQNVIWLDIVCLFPLLLMGLEQLQDGKKTLFIITLTAGMVINYYLGYMLVVFLLLYAFLWVLLKKDKKFAGNFLLSCAVAALLSAVVWLPSLLQYFGSGRTVSLFESLSNSSIITPYATALPTVFSMLFLFPFAIGGMEKAEKDGLLRGILFALTLLPLIFEPISKMWQTGNYMSFPTRYAFIPIFLCLTLTADCLTKQAEKGLDEPLKEKNGLPMYALNALVPVLAVGYCIFAVGYTNANVEVMDQYSQSLWGNDASVQALWGLYAVALTVGLAIFLLQRFQTVKPWALGLAVAVFTLSELYVAPVTYMRTPAHEVDDFQNIVALSGQIQDDTFYRVKTEKEYSSLDFDVNMMGAIGYNALGHYTSLTSSKYMTAIKQFGYTSYWMEVGNSGGTVLTDALLSVKYQISTQKTNFDVAQSDRYGVSPTLAYLPLGVIAAEDIVKESETADYTDRAELQKTLYQDFFGNTDGVTVYALNDATATNLTVEKRADGKYVLTPEKDKVGSLTFRVSVAEKQSLYFDVFDENDNSLRQAINGKFTISAPSKSISKFPAQKQNGLLYLGDYADKTFNVTVSVTEKVAVRSLGLVGIENNALTSAAAQTQTLGLQAVKNGLTGSYTAKGGECVFLSTAYDSGMRLTINGKRAELYEVYGGFTAFYLQAGENEIELSYTPQGFGVGVALSCAGAILCVLACAWWIKKKQAVELPQGLETVAYYGVIVAGALVVVAVYIAPMLLAIL